MNFSLFDSSPTDTAGNSEYATIELTEDICDRITTAADDAPKGISVRPFKDNEGIQGGIDLLESLHNPITTGRLRTKNVSPAHAYEIQYTNGRINFQFVPANDDWLGTFSRQLKDKYPNSQFETTHMGTVTAEPGMHVAGARIGLKKYTLYPIKHVGIEGFSRDPFGGITSELVGTRTDDQAPADVLLQVMFRPALDSWWQGIDGGPSTMDIGTSLQSPSYRKERRLFTRTTIEDPPSQKEKDAAKIVRDMENEHGWEMNLRVLAASEDAEVARQRASSSSTMFRNYFESTTGQRFEAGPLSGDELRESLTRAAGREFVDQNIVKSETETAGLVHVPNSEINQQDVQWALSRAGYGVPPGTPRIDFSDLDVAMASEKEKQVAMIESSDRGDPYMFGLGTRNGIEAGVTEDTLDTHMFVGGQSGRGKTSFAKNLFRQVADRDYGCLVYDPKGMDAEDFASLVPEIREDDLIFIELGSNREHQVGFNFLEVPGTADPGTPEHAAALEAMADDLEAILPLAAGDNEGSWGTRMSWIARNIARGLGRLDREVTLYDAHLIASEAAGREAYADLLEEEDINFIQDYARNHLAEMDNDKIEAFAGRLQQLIENETVREIVTITDGFSIDEAVEEGKIIIVQDNDPSSTTGQMVATTLLRRLWVSIREQTFDDDRPDPDQFYAILDEFNEIATVNSDIADIFADARSFGLSLVALTQDMSGQLGEEIVQAVEGQAETFITYNPGREGDARTIESQHSDDMDYTDLLDLPKYRFLMRTHDEDGELTHSYKVDATPPIDELAPEVARSDEETEALIDRRVRNVGNERRTDEEIMDSAALYGDTSNDEDDENDVSTTDSIVQATVLKAVYDAGYYSVDPNGFVSLQDAADRIRRYLDRNNIDISSETPAQLEALLPVAFLKIDRGEDLRVCCTDEGKMRFLSPVEPDADPKEINENIGGFEHAQLMRDAYDQFLEIGLPMQICHQDGDDDPDARAMPDVEELRSARSNPELEPTDVADHVAQFREQNPLLDRLTDGKPVDIEAEHSTGDTAPATTLKHIARTVSDGRRCLLLARPETAERIARRIDEYPECMRSFSGEDGAHRLYNTNGPIRVGSDDLRVYRPTGGQSVWLYHEDEDSVELRNSDGETLATFADPTDVFTDPRAYPATEADSTDFDEWSIVKRPLIPSVAFGEGGLDREMVDVIEVADDGTLHVLTDGGDTQVPINDLVDEKGSETGRFTAV